MSTPTDQAPDVTNGVFLPDHQFAVVAQGEEIAELRRMLAVEADRRSYQRAVMLQMQAEAQQMQAAYEAELVTARQALAQALAAQTAQEPPTNDLPYEGYVERRERLDEVSGGSQRSVEDELTDTISTDDPPPVQLVDTTT